MRGAEPEEVGEERRERCPRFQILSTYNTNTILQYSLWDCFYKGPPVTIRKFFRLESRATKIKNLDYVSIQYLFILFIYIFYFILMHYLFFILLTLCPYMSGLT